MGTWLPSLVLLLCFGVSLLYYEWSVRSISLASLLELTSILGYDGSLMGSINALHNYTTYYRLPPKGNSGTGIVFAIFNVGQMVIDFGLVPRGLC